MSGAESRGKGVEMDSTFTNNSMLMMERSMQYLWVKQAAHLDNIANSETPGYKVKTVSFEENFRAKLRAAIRSADSSRKSIREAIENARWKVEEDEEITRMDENGVNVLEQSLESVRAAYQIQYIYQAISNDLSTLNTAITG